MRSNVASIEAERTVRTTKDDWLNLAVQALIEDGIDRVKVQLIAHKLKVSRSSFYYFFKDTKDLQSQMVEFWLRKNTGPIIERAMRPADTIAQAILNVFECWMDSSLFDPQLDVAVRIWARRSNTVDTVVTQADEQRVDALTRMFIRYEYEQEEALVRARVLYFTQIGYFTLDVPESMKMRFKHVESCVRVFSGHDAPMACMDNFRRFTRQFHLDV
jgi:AcrR family transcriptional regulator